jgi:hypothetical protein
LYELIEISLPKADFAISLDKMHGFVTWFEVIFEGKDPNRKQIILSTSPYNK